MSVNFLSFVYQQTAPNEPLEAGADDAAGAELAIEPAASTDGAGENVGAEFVEELLLLL